MEYNEVLLPGGILDLVEDRKRLRVVSSKEPNCGLSAACRAVLTFENGSRAFLKAATNEETEQWLRIEYYVLSSGSFPFMPRIEEWVDEKGSFPALILEDLSDAYWPASPSGVTWREGDIEELFRTISELSRVKGFDGLKHLKNPEESNWRRVLEEEQDHFLDLGLCSLQWLDKYGDLLVREEMNLECQGDDLLHGDIRSDNVCFKDDRVVFVDWSEAAKGNGCLNLLSVLSTLLLEGGPEPFEMASDGAPWAANSSGRLVRRLLRADRQPKWLREVLKKLIAIDLMWFARSLELDPPDGIRL